MRRPAHSPDPPTTPSGARWQPPSISLPTDTERVLDATVIVESGQKMGSGVLVSPDGFALTAAHVASGPTIVQLRNGMRIDADVVRRDEQHDIALIKLRATVPTCLALRADAALTGEELFVVGAPASKELAFSISRGIVSGVREVDGVRLVQTDASINKGNSGGPMLDQHGQVLGITSFKLVGQSIEGLAFGVPASTALERLSLTLLATSSDAALSTVSTPARTVTPRVVDDPDPPYGARAQSKSDGPPRPRTRGSAIALRVIGASAAATGGLILLTEGSGARNLGFALMGVGVPLFVISFIIPKAPAQPAPQPRASAALSTRGAMLDVRF